MNAPVDLSFVDVSVAGTPIRIITDGMPLLHGEDLAEKMDFMRSNLDWIRQEIACQPKTPKDQVTAIISEPITKTASVSIFFIDALTYQPMCGAGIFGTVKGLYDTGYFSAIDGSTECILDTPSGHIYTDILIQNGRVEKVTFENTPAFIFKKDVSISLPSYTDLTVDIVFGGNFFVIIDVEQLNLNITQINIPLFQELQQPILNAVRDVVSVQHPIYESINYVDQVLFVQEEAYDSGHLAQCVFGSQQIDLSPCGTGTCARMANRYGKGQLALNQIFKQTNITDLGAFTGKLKKHTKVGSYLGCIPQLSCEHIHVRKTGTLTVSPR